MKHRRRAGRIVAGAAALTLASSLASPLALAEDGPTLADREAIEATMYRYARGLDRLDPELYVSAYAPDGEFVAGTATTKGRDALAKIVQGVKDRREEAAKKGEPARQLFHMDANASIEFLGPDHALHHAYFLTLSRTGAGAESKIAVEAIGSTTDELRKIDGQWLIVRREVLNGP